MPHQRCPSSPNTSVKRIGAHSPRGVSSSRTSTPLRPRTLSSSSPNHSPSTREFGLTVRSMFVVRLIVTWLTRDRIRIWWEKEKEKLPTSLFVRLKKLSRRQDLKKNNERTTS